ncbi:MAG: hypothetical protein WBN88_18415 [Anderseniella sp.]
MTIESPLKLDTAYDPVGLWNFDGDPGTDEGAAGEDLVVARGTAYYATGISPGTKGLFFTDALGLQGTSSPAPAALRIIGDVTFQCVMRFAEFGIGTFGSEMISCKGTTASEIENICYAMNMENDANRMSPQFQWEYGAGSTRVSIASTDFTFTTHRWYHIVMRRTDVGGGNSLGEIIVNNRLVASATDVSASGGGNAIMQSARNSSGYVALPKCVISSIKINDRALTDAELGAEFTRSAEAVR